MDYYHGYSLNSSTHFSSFLGCSEVPGLRELAPGQLLSQRLQWRGGRRRDEWSKCRSGRARKQQVAAPKITASHPKSIWVWKLSTWGIVLWCFFLKRQVHLCYPRVLNFDQDILPAAGNASRLQREELWTRLLHSDWGVTDAWRQWLPFYLSRWNTHWAIEHNFADWLLLGWFHLFIYIYIYYWGL